MMESYDGHIYQNEFKKMLERSSMLRAVKVLHQETCQGCGRTLVNIYRRGSGRFIVWRCKKCWDKFDNNPQIQRMVKELNMLARDEKVHEILTAPMEAINGR